MSIPSWAKVGAKVVCVDADTGKYKVPGIIWDSNMSGLIEGNVYTIRSVFLDCLGEYCIRLTEIHRDTPHGPYWLGEEAGYGIERFRPVHTLRSDVRMFKSLYRDMPASERLNRLAELPDEPETTP